MEEYAFEDGPVNLKNLQAEKLPEKDYKKAHQHLPIPCHDILVEYNNGFLLVIRDNYPCKGSLFPIGGRIERGLTIEDSIKKKVKEECGLEAIEIQFLTCARTFFKTDPFNHGKGTDTVNLIYTCKGKGTLKLDKLHTNPIIVTKDVYSQEFKKKLHPYVRDMLDAAFKMKEEHF